MLGVSGQRAQNTSSLQKGSNPGNSNQNYTRNVAQGMGNSEWDMLTMLSTQQKQLKNAQNFLLNSQQLNYEHARKMQLDTSAVSEAYFKGKGSVTGAPANGLALSKQEGFIRASVG